MYNGARYFRRRCKRPGRQRHDNARLAAPLCQQGQTPVGLGAGCGNDTLGHLIGEPRDLEAMRDELAEQCSSQVTELQTRFGAENIEYLPAEPMVEIQYPVEQYPEKVKSLNLDKSPLVEGVLIGIKGQYLILDTGVINIRKYSGYKLDVDLI